MLLAAGGAGATGKPGANPENIQIGLSTDRVAITADFSGADLTIFGSLDNADPLVSRQGRYDVIVVLEGPARPVVVRRKDRVLGMWINMESRNLRQRAGLLFGGDDPHAAGHHRSRTTTSNCRSARPTSTCEPEDRATANPATIEEFTAALRERKSGDRPLQRAVGGVEFLSQSLFRATLTLAPNVPVGTHKARAFLFRNGVFIKESSAQLAIVKSGFEQSIFLASRGLRLFLWRFRRVAGHVDRLARAAWCSGGIEIQAYPGRSIDPAIAEDAPAPSI